SSTWPRWFGALRTMRPGSSDFQPVRTRWRWLKRDKQRRRWRGENKLVAHTGLEPVISALRGQRVNQLHQCAVVEQPADYRCQCEAWQTSELNVFEPVFGDWKRC